MSKALLSSPFVAMSPRSRSVIVSTTTLRTAALVGRPDFRIASPALITRMTATPEARVLVQAG